MALAIDTARSLRTHAELVSLIEAVRDAPAGEPETDALEWKRELDLGSSASHRFNLARHILGFGNRFPSAAAPYFEGCAYLLVGVEPGAVSGAPAWDPADLHNWVERYVAPGAPRWRTDAVTVDGAHVLVFTMEPPAWGDPIRTLQTGYDRHPAGRIFVRRGGKTAEASPSEVVQLEARLTRGSADIELDLELNVPGGEVTPLSLAEAVRERWVARERERLLAGLAVATARGGGAVTYDASSHSHVFGDHRSESAYRAEVVAYLDRAALRWEARALSEAVRQDLGRVELTIRNPTPRNFPGTQVELRLAPGVRAFFDEDGPEDLLKPPEPPTPWGDLTVLSAPLVPLPRTGARAVLDEVVYDDEGATVRFHPVQVRPGGLHRLPDLHLAVPDELRGQHLAGQWRATSTGASRWAEGALELSISDRPAVPASQRESPEDDTPAVDADEES